MAQRHLVQRRAPSDADALLEQGGGGSGHCDTSEKGHNTMSNRTEKGHFKKGVSGNPGGRPKLPAEIREMFQAKSQDALEVLIRCMQSDDERIAMMAAQAIL